MTSGSEGRVEAEAAVRLPQHPGWAVGMDFLGVGATSPEKGQAQDGVSKEGNEGVGFGHVESEVP